MKDVALVINTVGAVLVRVGDVAEWKKLQGKSPSPPPKTKRSREVSDMDVVPVHTQRFPTHRNRSVSHDSQEGRRSRPPPQDFADRDSRPLPQPLPRPLPRPLAPHEPHEGRLPAREGRLPVRESHEARPSVHRQLHEARRPASHEARPSVFPQPHEGRPLPLRSYDARPLARSPPPHHDGFTEAVPLRSRPVSTRDTWNSRPVTMRDTRPVSETQMKPSPNPRARKRARPENSWADDDEDMPDVADAYNAAELYSEYIGGRYDDYPTQNAHGTTGRRQPVAGPSRRR